MIGSIGYRTVKWICRELLAPRLSVETRYRWASTAAEVLGVDVLDAAHRYIGVGICHPGVDPEEHHVLSLVRAICSRVSDPVVLDVGANTGTYALALNAALPTAQIHAFEPSPAAFRLLASSLSGTRVSCHNCALSDHEGRGFIHTYMSDPASAHASMYAGVFSSIHGNRDISKTPITMTTIDGFCAARSITSLAFLKIDTEGHELQVLVGAQGMLSRGGIKAIQFEFNEMNVISRVFLRDFYEMLNGFTLHRLSDKGLLALGPYRATNEIFRYQNILALHESAAPLSSDLA
jgi:FkbM family methyltransferase